MKMCKECHDRHVANGWYISADDDEIVDSPENCLCHPVLTNWKVARTLGFFVAGSLEPAGYRHAHCPGVRWTLEDGWVHLRTSKAILFDYEVIFIDLLIEQGFLEYKPYDGEPARVRPTLAGSAWLRKRELDREAAKKVDQKLDAELAGADTL